MAYSIHPILHDYANKDALHKILIQVIYNRIIVKVATDYRVAYTQFEKGEVVNHKNKISINGNIRNVINGIETRLIDSLRTGKPTRNELIKICTGESSAKDGKVFTDFIKDYCKEMTGKKAAGTLAVYNSLIADLDEYAAKLPFSKINVTWLNLYEKHQRSLGWDVNTIHKKMNKIKTLLNRAADSGYIDSQFYIKYTVPLYIQKIPEYISETEMQAIKDKADELSPVYKMSGYYFLLSCYAGYRLSDLKKFDYNKVVKGDKIILKAKKNGSIISMPLHTRLAEVLEYVKHHPLNITEQHLRIYVKALIKLAGINRPIKIHSARHSFAMMLMDNDFELDDVAALLGNSLKSAAIYGRISNKRLENKVRTKLG